MTRLEAPLPAILVKQVHLGAVISGPTGPEMVINTTEDGTEITVHDTLGRTWYRTRHENGWWTVITRNGGA